MEFLGFLGKVLGLFGVAHGDPWGGGGCGAFSMACLLPSLIVWFGPSCSPGSRMESLVCNDYFGIGLILSPGTAEGYARFCARKLSLLEALRAYGYGVDEESMRSLGALGFPRTGGFRRARKVLPTAPGRLPPSPSAER